MTSTNRLLCSGVLLAVTALLAGCGSSGPSKADFVKKADAVCAQTNKAHPPKPNPKSPKEAAAQQAEEITIRRELDTKLKAVKPPDNLKKDFDAYNAGTQRIIAAIDKMRADAQANKEKKYAADSKVFEQEATSRERIAVKLGFKTCGRKNPVQ
jgi:hypothetical protein